MPNGCLTLSSQHIQQHIDIIHSRFPTLHQTPFLYAIPIDHLLPTSTPTRLLGTLNYRAWSHDSLSASLSSNMTT